MQPSRADVMVQGDGPRSPVKCEDLSYTTEMWVNYTDLKLASWPFVFLCSRTSRTVHCSGQLSGMLGTWGYILWNLENSRANRCIFIPENRKD